MQITSVYLNNIKSYEEQHLDLSPGLTAISGENGAGKSTIVEAIGYALFGFTGVPLAALMREGQTSAEIRVGYVSPLDGREYESVRSLRKSRAGAVSAAPKLMDAEHGGPMAEGREEVDRFLRRTLGFGDSAVDLKSIFADVSGVPQGRLTADFIDTPQSRKSKFDPLLGTHDFRAAFNALRKPLNLLDNRRSELEQTLAALEERLKDLPQVTQAIKEKTSTAAEVAALLDRAVDQLRKARAVTADLNARKESIDRLKAEISAGAQTLELHAEALDAAAARVSEAEKAAKRADASSAQSAEYRSTEERFHVEQARLAGFQRLSTEIGVLEANLGVHQKRRDQAQADLDELSRLHARLPDLQKAVESQSELEDQLDEARRRAAVLANAREQIARIESEIAGHIAGREEYERRIADAHNDRPLAAQVDDLQQRIVDLSASITSADAAHGDLQLFSPNVDGLSARVAHERLELAGVERRIESGPESSDRQPDLHHLRQALKRAIERGAHLVELYSVRLEAADPIKRTELEAVLEETRERLRLARAAEEKAAGIAVWEDQVNTLSQRIEAQNALVAEARTAEAQALKAQSEAIALAEQIDEFGDPDPRSRLQIARSELARRKSIEAELADARDAIASSTSKLASLREEIGPLVNTPELVNNLRRSLASLRPAHERHLKDSAVAGSLPALLEERESARAKANQAGQAVERSKRLLEKQAKQFDPENLTKAREHESALQTEVGALQSRREQLDAELRRLEDERLELLEVQRESGVILAKVKRTETLQRVTRLIRNSLRDAGPEVTKAMVFGVSNSANEIFCEIMGSYDQSLQWDEEYGIWLESGGYRRSFRQLSGGEQITAALSVRLALLRDLLRIDTAFLDEPTQNLDATRRENLAEQIQRITGFSQLFVISHDDTFERLLQSVIHVEKINGVSRVRVQ
ncbi:MAG: SMC family ATPase [Chloroflexi bacterium]|nr:SMC family ATPase [Chloroflexota bacterium]MCY3937351.1 SMC family ATPase [Chloroflexota bacterium]